MNIFITWIFSGIATYLCMFLSCPCLPPPVSRQTFKNSSSEASASQRPLGDDCSIIPAASIAAMEITGKVADGEGRTMDSFVDLPYSEERDTRCLTCPLLHCVYSSTTDQSDIVSIRSSPVRPLVRRPNCLSASPSTHFFHPLPTHLVNHPLPCPQPET